MYYWISVFCTLGATGLALLAILGLTLPSSYARHIIVCMGELLLSIPAALAQRGKGKPISSENLAIQQEQQH